MNGTLYIVATPIGNLGDMTSRGHDVLATVATIACEDTRRTSQLLSQLGITKPKMLAYHEHNEAEVAATIVQLLQEGQHVALVSDAGTPLLSDPGYELVRQCWAAGIKPVPIPGPSAPMAALSVCPISCAQHQFVGFLPAKAVKRWERLQSLAALPVAVVFFEAPHRIESCLQDIAQLLPSRRVFVAREVTKKFEQLLFGTGAAVLDELLAANAVRGEFVCVLEGAPMSEATGDAQQEHARELLVPLLDELSPTQAARLASKITGLRKGPLYDMALRIKGAKD